MNLPDRFRYKDGKSIILNMKEYAKILLLDNLMKNTFRWDLYTIEHSLAFR